MLPTGDQRSPVDTSDYVQHVKSGLNIIDGHFHSAWIPDHLQDGQQDIPEALTAISYLSALYPSLYFGTCVLSQSFRNPALLAKMGATLQQLSDGRFIMGIGAGWKKDEYLAYNYEFPKASTRIAQMSETVQILKKMWDSTDDTVSYAGQYYQVDNATCNPKPNPTPPIMVGGGGVQLTMRVVAQHADWWNLPGVPPSEYKRKLDILKSYCDEYQRDPSSIRKTWMGVVSMADTEENAQKQLSTYPIWEGDVALVGTQDMIISQLEAYVAIGVDLFILSFVDEPKFDGIHQFIDQVIPQIS